MAYETPTTIKDVIDNIKRRQYVLPAIQREFVWDTEQIETLFDSLMRDYPISTFLFWKIDKTRIKTFQLYEFLKRYHEKDNRRNQKVDLPDSEDIIAVLDGQQRMTSLYLALTGTYAEKRPHLRKNNPLAYPVKKLYLNLLKPLDDNELEYNFKFLTEDEAQEARDTEAEEAQGTKDYFWFECGKILDFKEMSQVSLFLMKNKLMDTSIYTEKQSEFAINTLNEFFNVIHQKGTISYFLEKSEELDKVLQIFIRINSGGTKLSYSDLLLSIATAQWGKINAREVIYEFVDEINQIGDRFDFNKDIVLKSCLVLADLPSIKFKVDNFNKKNMDLIESKWDGISAALRSTVELISKFGYNQDNLWATNAIIPIAYFIYVNECRTQILHHDQHAEDRKAIKEWLARVFLKGTFGGQPDSIYPTMRDLINKHTGRFPLKEIIAYYRGRPKSISFTEDEIENLLDLQSGKPQTYCALTLLYPALNYNFKYHQDHIHPKSMFNKREMRKAGFSEEQIEQYASEMNGLSNLQLLEGTQNLEKSDQPFNEWLNSSGDEKDGFLRQHHINSDDPLDFKDFLVFVEKRKENLKNKFAQILTSTQSGIQ